MRLILALGMLLTCLVAPARAHAQSTAPENQTRFPHAQHEKLFPQCSGCHQGIPTGDRATSFPDSALCGECHNNRDQQKVAWSTPYHAPSNLKFSHREHDRQSGAKSENCSTCHAPRSPSWMHVERATPAQCRSCHTHNAAAHFSVDNRCATCHLTLAQATRLPLARLAAFQKPESHEKGDFAQRHGTVAAAAQSQCAFCHAKESCARCHVNGTRVAAQFGLLADARVATLVAGRKAVYVAPATHRAAAFLDTHGKLASANVQSCANCHARSSCQACHTGTGAAETIRQLPIAEKGSAAGVQIIRVNTPWNSSTDVGAASSHIALGPATAGRFANDDQPRKAQVHAPGFARTHGAPAASGQLTCEGCHSRSYCADCHGGESKRRFHVANFASRHAPEARPRNRLPAVSQSRGVLPRLSHSGRAELNRSQQCWIPLRPATLGAATWSGRTAGFTELHQLSHAKRLHAVSFAKRPANQPARSGFRREAHVESQSTHLPALPFQGSVRLPLTPSASFHVHREQYDQTHTPLHPFTITLCAARDHGLQRHRLWSIRQRGPPTIKRRRASGGNTHRRRCECNHAAKRRCRGA